MQKSKTDFQDPSELLRYPVLSPVGQIDTGLCQVPSALHPVEPDADAPPLTNAELVQLQIRVIALEQLVTVLLSEASDRQRGLAVDLANDISPRAGFTPHRLTLHASAQMTHLFGRASLFKAEPPNNTTCSRLVGSAE